MPKTLYMRKFEALITVRALLVNAVDQLQECAMMEHREGDPDYAYDIYMKMREEAAQLLKDVHGEIDAIEPLL